MNSSDLNSISKILKDLYLKNDYEAAIDLLKNQQNSMEEGLFHYNLGSLYLKTKNYGKARQELELAKSHGFELAELHHNLSYVESKLNLDDFSTSHNPYDQSINFLKSLNQNIYLSATMGLLLVGFLSFRLMRKSKMYLFVFILFSLIPFSFKSFYLDNLKFGIANKNARVYEGPNDIFADSGELIPGTKFLISRSSGSWFFIEKPYHISGWIKSKSITLID